MYVLMYYHYYYFVFNIESEIKINIKKYAFSAIYFILVNSKRKIPLILWLHIRLISSRCVQDFFTYTKAATVVRGTGRNHLIIETHVLFILPMGFYYDK